MQNLIDAVCSESSHHIIHNCLLSKSNEMFWLYSFPPGEEYFVFCKFFFLKFMHITITQKDNCGLELLKYVSWEGLLYLLGLSTLQRNIFWSAEVLMYFSVFTFCVQSQQSFINLFTTLNLNIALWSLRNQRWVFDLVSEVCAFT